MVSGGTTTCMQWTMCRSLQLAVLTYLLHTYVKALLLKKISKKAETLNHLTELTPTPSFINEINEGNKDKGQRWRSNTSTLTY
jgi:hypothetical protein